MAGVQRGVFALVGPFKFHSISLCGRLDSLPVPRHTLRVRRINDLQAHLRGALFAMIP